VRRLVLTTALASFAIAAPASAERIISFTSPTGNIGCIVSDKYGARCDIRKRDWPRGPRPSGCPSFEDYGQGLWVARKGRGHIVCAGDTALTTGHPLAYGHSRSIGRFTCVSHTTGMTCRNRRNGHGFTLARERYRLF
jgi:hypothetical protein